ncbi:MAG: type II and III secretion system protein [bacterium]
MKNKTKHTSSVLAVLAVLSAGSAFAQQQDNINNQMVAVSADIVEISGSIQTTKGFTWSSSINFAETLPAAPGIIKVGEFERRSNLTTLLKMLETEGKAQTLSNPKAIVLSGQEATFQVGGKIPFPTVNTQGVGFDWQSYGIVLKIFPEIRKKNIVSTHINLEISNPDYSRTVITEGGTVPSMISRGIDTMVEMKSGETLVIGGLKRSNRSVAKSRIPVLGKIPLLGALFSSTDVFEEQSSLFLFVTFDIVK